MSYNLVEKKLKANGVVILDGGNGGELESSGAKMDKDLWAGKCAIDDPDKMLQVHEKYINAGADIITTSNYQATPELLKREPSAPPYEELAKRALELCQEAVIETNTNTKIAGCYPPIHVTFRPDLSPKEKVLRKF